MPAAAATTQTYIPHQPSPKQQQFLRLTCREALYGGSAGCGKSDALLMAALQGIHIPSYSAILFRKTYKDLALPGALMDRARKWWSGTDARWNNDEKCWRFPTGARIGFGYLENDADLDRYQSAEFQFIGFDESTQFTDKQRTTMFARLRRTADFPSDFPLRVRDATNPGGIGHKGLVRRFHIPEGVSFPAGAPPIVTRNTDGSILRVFVPAHATDNPGLDWKDYMLSLAELPETRRQQLRDGIWIEDSSGLVYGAAANAIYVDRLPDGYDWSCVLAIDLGATNNCAFVIYAISPYLPEIYMVSATKPPGLNTPRDVATHVKTLIATYRFERITGDHGALGKGYLEEMRRYFDIPIQNAQKQDKRGYIELYNGALENGTVRIVRPTCLPWIEEAEHLLWKDERKLEEMPGMANHCCDGGLYGWREARHYSHDAKGPPPKSKMDAIEQAVQSRFDLQRAAQKRDGVALPTWFR